VIVLSTPAIHLEVITRSSYPLPNCNVSSLKMGLSN